VRNFDYKSSKAKKIPNKISRSIPAWQSKYLCTSRHVQYRQYSGPSARQSVAPEPSKLTALRLKSFKMILTKRTSFFTFENIIFPPFFLMHVIDLIYSPYVYSLDRLLLHTSNHDQNNFLNNKKKVGEPSPTFN
jgi:hypothetical protein